MANTVQHARVVLTKALTFEGRGRTFVKGQPQVMTLPADIAYYQQQPEFTVTLFNAPQPPAPKKPVSVKPVAPAPAESEDDEDEEGDGDEGDEEAEADAPADEGSFYTEADLKKTKKEALLSVAKEEFGLEPDANASKSDLISMILAAQAQKALDD